MAKMFHEDIEFIRNAEQFLNELKKKKRLTIVHEDKLIHALVGLLGILQRIKKHRQLERLIDEMISFGELNGFSVEGPKIFFQKLKERQRITS
ncbi:hypothetical protein DRZ77_02985 [Candidatus Woesearchaeota archaeon]|nr:hypothetical protein [Candidatus Woesearchaeota archaeon]RLE40142.1 MAG: hypothetical protein DRZ77_02985 [Candidatus Woesearchaeota archaeon]